MRFGAVISVVIAVSVLVGGYATPADSFDDRLNAAVSPYRFDYVRWELHAAWNDLSHSLLWQPIPADGAELVVQFYSSGSRLDALRRELVMLEAPPPSGTAGVQARVQRPESYLDGLRAEIARLQTERRGLNPTAERVLAHQIREVLASEGIHNAINDWPIDLPPFNLRIEKPPSILVISPRSKIEFTLGEMLEPGLSEEIAAGIESEVDRLGVSSLVVEPGGFGASYPVIVSDVSNLPFSMWVACHEWAHQFLAFAPLGFLFILDLTGVRKDFDIYVMNETLADLVGREVQKKVLERYYPEFGALSPFTYVSSGISTSFNTEMRKIRQQVDSHLAAGNIDEAEAYMEERRLYLNSLGYPLRKLNQAYFAFFDSYANSQPSEPFAFGLTVRRVSSNDSIESDFRELRARSASLKEFLATAGRLTSREELRQAVER